ncbi:MAG: S8 family serine peptidase [Rhodomicrobium sp.]|nr:S8 family serine peptidase [Rhodomicrobium sp.]
MSHPSLKNAKIVTQTFRSSDRAASRRDHGTAVVSLLVGDPASKVAGLIPQARILAADAFHKSGSGDSADTFDLVKALDWLIAEQVRVVNLSLSGPDNDVLKKAVERALSRDVVIVAAAGRPDNGTTNGFPGRYNGVIAVSAVDERLRSSRLSAKGEHVSFSAPGVGVNVAAPGGGTRLVDGTSFATPFVAAAFAFGLENAGAGKEAANRLATAARDLGAAGKDPIYGWGLIQYGNFVRCGN